MSKTTILIVEDERIVADNLAGKLAQLGYEVAGIAAGAKKAVALADRLHPNLVLMDIWLEGPMDGIEAAEVIRQQHDVPVIYLTAHSDPATLARARSPGHSATSSSRSSSGNWQRRSSWRYTSTRPTGNSATSASGSA